MSDLVAFLEERLAEDEEVARASAPRRYVGTSMTNLRSAEPESRALREVEAKRAIVRTHQQVVFTDRALGLVDVEVCAVCHSMYVGEDDWADSHEPVVVQEPFPCVTVRALATVYADHPDYREEWRP